VSARNDEDIKVFGRVLEGMRGEDLLAEVGAYLKAMTERMPEFMDRMSSP
jgi:hypothetical protein